MRLTVGLLATAAALAGVAASPPPPLPHQLALPPQFHANISIVAHLVDKTKPYPPWRRRIEVWYDLPARKARALVYEGFEANKTFLRRYDIKQEYLIRDDEFAECRRAYLSEPMEEAAFPADLARRPGTHVIAGRPCAMYLRKDAYTRVRVYVDAETGLPLSVTDEYNNDGAYEAVMSWTFESLHVGPQDPSVFELPHPWTHKRCKRHIGGWPYLHLFHHYLKI